MGPQTSEARALFTALRAAYDVAFQEFSRQVLSLQSILNGDAPESTAIEEARRRVEQAQSIYRDCRDSLARFLLSQDMKGAPPGSVVRLAHQLWESDGRPAGKADEHWYRAERMIQNAH